MVGGVLSCTTMVRLQVLIFPQASVAVQVLTLVNVAPHIFVVISEDVTTGVGSQRSVAVAATQTGAFGQLTGVACVWQVMVGGVLSCTTMVRLQVLMFPQASVAVQVLTLVNVAPHIFVVISEDVTTGAGSQRSVAVGATHTGAFGQLTGVTCV